MKGIGIQCLAVGFGCNPAEGPRAPKIYPHREKHDKERSQSRGDFNMIEEQPPARLIDDPYASEKKQCGFNKCGKILDFAVAVLVVGIGWFVGDSDRQ